MKPTGDSFVGRKGLPEAKLLLEGPEPGPAQLRWVRLAHREGC